jgi:hypothetical protein
VISFEQTAPTKERMLPGIRQRTAMLRGFLTALPVVAVIAACDLALLYGALWLGGERAGRSDRS